jgi:hypothetical protein
MKKHILALATKLVAVVLFANMIPADSNAGVSFRCSGGGGGLVVRKSSFECIQEDSGAKYHLSFISYGAMFGGTFTPRPDSVFLPSPNFVCENEDFSGEFSGVDSNFACAANAFTITTIGNDRNSCRFTDVFQLGCEAGVSWIPRATMKPVQ